MTSLDNVVSEPKQIDLFNAFEQLLFQDAVTIFHELEGKNKAPSYKGNYVSPLAFFTNKYLHQITKVDIEEWRKKRSSEHNTYRVHEKIRFSTVNREHAFLTRLFNAFKEWKGSGEIKGYNFTQLKLPVENPGELVSKPSEAALARTLVLTPMEFYRYLDYAHPKVRVIVILALLTLLRRKNLQFMDKSNFNVALQQLTLVQSKTGVPITIPVPQTVQVIINDAKYSCPCDFTNFRKLHERARRESGVYFWLTDLRRTGATQMLLDGVDLKTIQRYLGHTTLVMTERYIQPPVENMKIAAKKIESRFAQVSEMVGV